MSAAQEPAPPTTPLPEKQKHCSDDAGARSVPLKVLPAQRVKPSRASRWRAGVLITVHLIIIAHIIQWLIHGMTLSPVEPSESMYTLETGRINAGFIFFALALVSTLVVGRYFCGWGCHIIAVQDLCSWLMRKCGIHPKPFRSRLLILFPLGLALYMFVWPTFRREVIQLALDATGIAMPAWLGETAEFPGFRSALIVTDFWATFGVWWMAFPFLFACGFAIVYFMGSKAFCSFGCPYGGFFGVIDRFSPGRIVVSDDCNSCGHCTAACTSNVRVHEEVRDYGMVVDAGCMKTMDCVSVCPNKALSFSFAIPAAFAKPRTPEAAERRRTKARNYDLSLIEDVWVALLMLALIWCFRGMFNLIPLLMAMALAAIGAFFAFKLVSLVREPSVRLAHHQIKVKGRLTWLGRGFIAAALLYLAAGAWSGTVRFFQWRAENISIPRVASTIDDAIRNPDGVPPWDKEEAVRAIADLTRAGPWSEGGIGWATTPRTLSQLARLSIVAGKFDDADRYLTRTLEQSGQATDELPMLIVDLMARRAVPIGDAITRLDAIIHDHAPTPASLPRSRVRLAQLRLQAGQFEPAAASASDFIRAGADLGLTIQAAEVALRAASILDSQGNGAAAQGVLRRTRDALAEAVAKSPASAPLHHALGTTRLMLNEPLPAVESLREAMRLEPKNPLYPAMLSSVLAEMGQMSEARELNERSLRLQREAASPGVPAAPK